MTVCPEPDDLAALADIDRLSVTHIIRRTPKTLLAAGTYAGAPAVIKLALDETPEWRDRVRHEIEVYDYFATHTPPTPTPTLLHTDGSTLLVLEHVTGTVLGVDRYLATSPPANTMDAVTATIRSLNRWSPPSGPFTALDYRSRVSRYHATGFLTNADRNALHRLLDGCPPATEFNHGDPLPNNILIGAGETVTLVDWEFAGWFLPGFDLSMLHTVAAAHPEMQQRIDTIVDQTLIRQPFTVNRVMVITRELRIHRELPAGPLREERLNLLEHAWKNAQRDLHAMAAGGA